MAYNDLRLFLKANHDLHMILPGKNPRENVYFSLNTGPFGTNGRRQPQGSR